MAKDYKFQDPLNRAAIAITKLYPKTDEKEDCYCTDCEEQRDFRRTFYHKVKSIIATEFAEYNTGDL